MEQIIKGYLKPSYLGVEINLKNFLDVNSKHIFFEKNKKIVQKSVILDSFPIEGDKSCKTLEEAIAEILKRAENNLRVEFNKHKSADGTLKEIIVINASRLIFNSEVKSSKKEQLELFLKEILSSNAVYSYKDKVLTVMIGEYPLEITINKNLKNIGNYLRKLRYKPTRDLLADIQNYFFEIKH